MTHSTIAGVRFATFDVPLKTPFGIATGSLAIARNVVVEVELEDGTIGLGEAAPFPAVNGETQEAVMGAAADGCDAVTGLDSAGLGAIAAAVQEAAPVTPTLWCAIETAALDAFARHHARSLFHYFGGAVSEIESDITIVTGSPEAAAEDARTAAGRGFRLLKVKVGGSTLSQDLARLSAIAAAAPAARLLLDGNTAFSVEEACDLVRGLGPVSSRIDLFEQPGPASDLDGLRAVFDRTGIPVAADESARSVRDVELIGKSRAAQVVNIKIGKTGIVNALDMIAAARAHGLGLMIGGMVESKICMTTSACIAGGMGGFSYADLDTPLFMGDDVTQGGYAQEGPLLRLSAIAAGHGVTTQNTRDWRHERLRAPNRASGPMPTGEKKLQ